MASSPSWSARTELRVENTDFAYILNGEKVTEQSKSFTDWLPYVSIDYQNGNLSLGLSYSTSVDRPSYSMLSNTYSYASHTSWMLGNPLLKSSLERELSLDVSYRKTSLNLSYVHSMRELACLFIYGKQEGKYHQECKLA